MSQCWAMNGHLQRCEADGGHEGNHLISITWSDDECYQGTHNVSPPVTFPAAMQAIIDGRFAEAITYNAVDPIPIDDGLLCFSCESCTRDMHGPGGCERHGCRTFVA